MAVERAHFLELEVMAAASIVNRVAVPTAVASHAVDAAVAC